MSQYQIHELANIFPRMPGEEFAALKADIKTNGLLEPIWLYDGKVLDGRHRYYACQETSIEPSFREYTGVDPRGFVISLNLMRRHMNESQRSMVAAGLANLSRGARQDRSIDLSTTQEQAATMLNVSVPSVKRAAVVNNEGSPELIEAVQSGVVSVSAAADVATLPKQEQVEIVAKGEKEILLAAKTIRAKKAEDRRDERITKIVEISRGNQDLSSDKKYPVIYADPPWRYEHIETESRAIENQYPTMSLDEICDMPISNIAHDDCILFMWATSPKLEEAFRVLNAWGFTYRTCAVWDKEMIGMGYYFRQQHELLLVAVKGELPTPAPADRPSSVLREKRGVHSAKPEAMREYIESMYPRLDKIELFCRDAKEGWSVWGNQSEAA